MIIAIDFDGTCTTYKYPEIGEDIGAVPVLQSLVEKGHKLLLLTSRAGKPLDDAVQWCKAYGIPLSGVNENNVTDKFSDSPKVYANLYIDDSALGCPLKTDRNLSDKPFVDWTKARLMLEEKGIL